MTLDSDIRVSEEGAAHLNKGVMIAAEYEAATATAKLSLCSGSEVKQKVTSIGF